MGILLARSSNVNKSISSIETHITECVSIYPSNKGEGNIEECTLILGYLTVTGPRAIDAQATSVIGALYSVEGQAAPRQVPLRTAL